MLWSSLDVAQKKVNELQKGWVIKLFLYLIIASFTNKI